MALETNQFAHQFSAVLDLARWNERAGGRAAFFRSGRPDGAGPNVYETEMYRLAQVRHPRNETVFVPREDVAEPEWLSGLEMCDVDLDYAYTKLPAEGEPVHSTMTRTVRVIWRDTEGYWRMPNTTFRPATVGRACVRWMGLADNFEDLSLPTRVYLDWMHGERQVGTAGDNERFGARAVEKSLVIAQSNQQPYSEAVPFIDTFAQLDPANPNHRTVLTAAGLALDAVLFNEPGTRGSTRKGALEINRSLTVEAIKTFEDLGLLSPRWWVSTCILRGGVSIAPDLLPNLHARLTGENSADLLEKITPVQAKAAIEDYIGKLISAYAMDQSRDAIKMRKIKSIVVNKHGSADLAQLIAIANVIIKSENSLLDPSEHRPPLAQNSMYSVGDAILTVLRRTNSPDATQEVRASQFEQDILHAEIIDTLHSQLRGKRADAIREEMELSDLHSQYPNVPRAFLKRIARMNRKIV